MTTCPPLVGGDPGRLRQVLMNLVGNAVKFTERGEVAVTVKRAPSGKALAPAGSCVLLFSVRDTGIGIDPEARSRLFKAFVQADGSTTRRFGGTGLGLVISKQLVEMMGGEIDIESRPGEGSTFWFTATLTVAEAAGALPAPAKNLSGQRALIVDDNADQLRDSRALRQRLGHGERGSRPRRTRAHDAARGRGAASAV